jgi:hypothetical protein
VHAHAHEPNLNQVRQNKVAANNLVQTMDQPGFQQACDYSAPLSDQQNHLVAQHGNDPDGLSLTLTDWGDHDWTYVGCSQIATNVPSQAVPLFNPQPHSNPEPHSGLILHWDAASSTFGQSPGADLPLSAVDASTAEVNSILIPYGDTNYESFSGFEQALTAGAALAI